MSVTPAPPAALQERSRRTRRILLDAGAALLAEEGPDALTIAAVSERAGVAPGTVYRRFGDKDGLLAELQQEFTAGVRDEFGRRMTRAALPPGSGAAQAVDITVRALLDTLRAHERLLRVFTLLGLRDDRVLSTGARASREGGLLFRDMLWPHRDAFTTADPELGLDTAYRLVYAAAFHRLLHGGSMESPTEQSWDRLADDVSRAVTLTLLGEVPGRGRPARLT